MKLKPARLAALVIAMATACAAAPLKASEVSEACRTSPHLEDGTPSTAPDICAAVVSPAGGAPARTVDAAKAVDEIAAAADKSDFVLLGEIHDNPSHHRIRAQIILAMSALRTAAKRPAPSLVLEHIRADQDMAVAGFRALDKTRRRTVDDLFRALDWPRSGWPAEALFRPMLDAALEAEWPILHGNLTGADIRAVAKGGIGALEPAEAKRLGLDGGLGEAAENSLLDELVASHCGVMPREALRSMADAQRYRDAYMARRMVDAGEAMAAAVLLAGNGHVRADRGVPWHLKRMAPGKSVLVVMFTQADPAQTDALAYVRNKDDGLALADYVVVTPRVERPDPCEAMRKRASTPPKADPAPKEPGAKP